MNSKKCSGECGRVLALSEFQVRKASKDGRTAACRDCLKKRDRARYPKEREYRLLAMKAYQATGEGKKAHRKAAEKWMLSNRIKRACHLIFNNALRDGKIKKRPCDVCGKKAHAHHPDYDRPLDVIWLCQKHHKEAHAIAEI